MSVNNSNFYSNFSLATFIITYRCPISCPMCFFACGPNRDEVLSKSLALKTIEEVNELKINTIGITGGEPFLEVDLMRELVKKAASYGMTMIVVTNAFWGTSKKVALDRLEELRNLGLNWIQISLDDQHQQSIPIERVANVMAAAMQLDFEDIKLIGSSKGNSETFKYQLFYLQEVLGICIDNIDIIDRPRTSNQYFEDSEQVRYSFQELESIENLDLPITKPGDCLTELMIDVNGDIYPCCNNFIGRIGNLSANNLQNIVENLKFNKYFNLLKQYGPFSLARYLDKTFNTDFSNRRYGSWCELCARIFQNDYFRDLLANEPSLVMDPPED